MNQIGFRRVLRVGAILLIVSLSAAPVRASQQSTLHPAQTIAIRLECLGNRTITLAAWTEGQPGQPAKAQSDALRDARQIASGEANCVKAKLNGSESAFLQDEVAAIDSSLTDLTLAPSMQSQEQDDDRSASEGGLFAFSSLNGLQTTLESFSRSIQEGMSEAGSLSSAYADLEKSTGSNTGGLLVLPDPEVPFPLPEDAKLPSGAPVPGRDTAEKVRALAADQFERTVRIYMSGTEQTVLDMGLAPDQKPYPKIFGLYQGFRPDMMYPRTDGTIIQGHYDASWGACSITNGNNAVKHWFKSTGGTYVEERVQDGKIISHAKDSQGRPCTGRTAHQHTAFYEGRGKIVDLMMDLMRKIADDMKTGKVGAPERYYDSARNNCMKIAADIGATRKLIQFQRHALLQDLSDLRLDAGQLSCQKASQCSSGGQACNALKQLKARICKVESMQVRVEMQMVPRYAYCSWYSAAMQAQDEKLRELLGRNESVDPLLQILLARPGTESGGSNPLTCAGADWAGLLFGLLAAFSRRRKRGSRARLRFGVLAGTAALALSGCRGTPKMHYAKCGQGYDIHGVHYDYTAFQASNPLLDANGVPAVKSSRYGPTTSEEGQARLAGAHGEWIPICDFKCSPIRETISEYKKQIDQVLKDPDAPQSQKDEARQRLSDYDKIWTDAMDACQKRTIKYIYKIAIRMAPDKNGNYLAARQGSADMAGNGCECPVQEQLGLDEPFDGGGRIEAEGENSDACRYAPDSEECKNNQKGNSPSVAGVGDHPPDSPVIPSGDSNPDSGVTTLAFTDGGPSSTSRTNSSMPSARIGQSLAALGGGSENLGRGPGSGSGLTGFGTGPGLLDSTAESARKATGADPELKSDLSGGAYRQGGHSSGATAAARGGAGRELASIFDPDGGSSSTEGASTQARGANGPNVSPIGTPDPADYFARIDIGESLFKKVEKRYESQAQTWALMDARKGLRKLATQSR